MKEMRILNALEQVDEKYIEDAASAKQNSKKHVWVRWVAVAACLCLAVGIDIPRLIDVFQNKGGTPSQTYDGPDSLVQEISALEFNGAYYEATDIPEALERYGLPTVITDNMAGKHLSYLEPNDRNRYRIVRICSRYVQRRLCH